MTQRRRRIPSYRLHKPTGQAVVRLDGRDRYLGKHGSQTSHELYDRLIAEWLTSQADLGLTPGQPQAHYSISVNELILHYWQFVQGYYVKNGRATDEQAGIRSALRRVRELYGQQDATEFGPLCLKAVREMMIRADLSRMVVNQYVGRIKRMFKWGVENELVPVSVHQALMAVSGLRRGRSDARETEPVLSVSAKNVEKALAHISPVLQAMVRFQLFTGCRPDEVCMLRPGCIDKSDDVWCYRPESHKTEHRDRQRRVFIGPKSQKVLQPFLDRPEEAYCFNPRESVVFDRSRSKKTATRKDRARRPRLGRRRDHYDTDSYRRAITRACEKAGIPKWTPNQLRHSRATELRHQHGLEAAQTVLGHSRADVTQVYAERDFELARRIMAEVG